MSFPVIAAAGLKAIGSFAQGESNAQAAEYNAAVAQQNAAIAQQQGTAAVQAQQRSSARKIGAMVAAYGASGVQGDSGSAMDVLAESARMATLDKLTTKYNYDLRAMGYQQQAALDEYSADSARTSAFLNAMGAGADGYAKSTTQGTAIPSFGGGGVNGSAGSGSSDFYG